MKRRLTTVILIAIFIALLASVVTAQEDDSSEAEQELVAYVAGAFERMGELDTVRAAAEQSMVQDMSAQGVNVSIFVEQNADSAAEFNDDSPASSSTVRQDVTITMNGETMNVEMTLDLILIDDNFYMWASDLSPELVGTYPTGWVNVTEDSANFPDMEMLNLDQINQLTSTALQFPIAEDTVAAIEELEPDTLDNGLEMRVFSVQIDPQGLIDSEMFSNLSGMFNTGAMGVEADDMMRQMFADASIDLTIWIGIEDELVYRVETVIGIETELEGMLPGGQAVTLKQDISGRYDYYDFNEDVEIEAPEIDD